MKVPAQTAMRGSHLRMPVIPSLGVNKVRCHLPLTRQLLVATIRRSQPLIGDDVR